MGAPAPASAPTQASAITGVSKSAAQPDKFADIPF
jgi:hypothetical protein